jgi:hypothetical protein
MFTGLESANGKPCITCVRHGLELFPRIFTHVIIAVVSSSDEILLVLIFSTPCRYRLGPMHLSDRRTKVYISHCEYCKQVISTLLLVEACIGPLPTLLNGVDVLF